MNAAQEIIKLKTLEQSMREHATAINNIATQIEMISEQAAKHALLGIIQYLQDAYNDYN